MRVITTQAEMNAAGQEWVRVEGNTHVVARDESQVEARGHSHVEAGGHSQVEARGHSQVEAWGHSHVEACDNSYVEAWGSCHVEARGHSHVVACDNSHVEARSPYVSIYVHSPAATCVGGVIIGATPLSPEEYLSRCGIRVKRGRAILYKCLTSAWQGREGFQYPQPGGIVAAPDWDRDSPDECGKGLHFSPSVSQAKSFRHEEGGICIACEVAVEDMAPLPPFAEYPDKIRARACKVLYQCDKQGKKLKGAA